MALKLSDLFLMLDYFVFHKINCSSEVFSVYQHKEIVKGCCPHPGDIVEAGPLAVT